MLTVSTELQPILNGVVQFISYMVLAVFAENVILARALGVTRLMKLVPDHRAQVWDFCLPLLLVITLSAPAGWPTPMDAARTRYTAYSGFSGFNCAASKTAVSPRSAA